MNRKLYCHTIGCRLGYAVKGIMRMLRKSFIKKEINLTLEQYFLLNILNNEEGLILQDLAEIVDRDKSAVYHHIEGLEENHFVVRAKDPEDRRRKLLFITKPGMKVLQKALEAEEEITAMVTAQLSDKECADFERNLTTICDKALSLASS